MRTARLFSRFVGLTLACFLAGPAWAQAGQAKVTEYVPQGEVKAVDANASNWDYTLSLSANFALAQNSNMVGQPEGNSYLIGMGVLGSLLYVQGPHEFKLGLTLVESFTKTPVVDRLIKANDLAKLEGLYSYYFVDWLGAFARLIFESPLLRTEDLRSDAVDYSILRQTGVTEVRLAQKSLQLANGFQPLTLNQSLGLVARPLEKSYATWTIRAGAGARETLADGVLVNKDDKATLPIEFVETATVVQGGAELAMGVGGKLPAQRLSYGVDVGVLVPFLHNAPLNRSVGALTRVGLTGFANFSLWEWLGLTYQVLVQRDPQLIAGVQLQNNLFLTFKYDVIPAKKAPPPADPIAEAKAALEAAEKRVQEAESRAQSAEQKLRELQPAPTTP